MRWRDRFIFIVEAIFKSQAETGKINLGCRDIVSLLLPLHRQSFDLHPCSILLLTCIHVSPFPTSNQCYLLSINRNTLLFSWTHRNCYSLSHALRDKCYSFGLIGHIWPSECLFTERGNRTYRYMFEPISLSAIQTIVSMQLSSHALRCEMGCWGTSDESVRLCTLFPKTS